MAILTFKGELHRRHFTDMLLYIGHPAPAGEDTEEAAARWRT